MIHQLVRSDSESSERVRRKIRTEAEHCAVIEKDTAQQKHRAIQIDQEVAEAVLQHPYLQGKEPEKIQAATLRMRAAKYELNKIQRLEAAGLTSSSPNNPHYARVMKRGNPITDNRCAHEEQTLAYNSDARRIRKPPDKVRQENINASSVASL